MKDDLRCPNCGSSNVKDGMSYMECLTCHNREDLIDYEIHTSVYDMPDIEEPVPKELTDLQPIKNELLYLRNKLAELQSRRYPSKVNTISIYNSIIKEKDNESV